MKREPKIVKRGKGTYSVTTSLRVGGYYLCDTWWTRRYADEPTNGCGVFLSEQEAIAALAKATPVPDDAVWDDDNTAPQPVQPQPAMEWKPIANTLRELEDLKNAPIDVLLSSGDLATWSAKTALAEYRHNSESIVGWTIIPRPKPTPTVAELERAVVEAAVRVHKYQHGTSDAGVWDDFESAVTALLSARENAAKGGGNQRGDAAGVK